ncbi:MULTISPECIES: hypothetical protein [unclassified Photobacterium]|uniref:hypothetical protein n=1 Tax=unclassified Photobacterium TaxID=2628852 RepID=UPI000D15BD83|nr:MULTISPECIES: hypothetical protein [unclassified Photobacterium]PSV26340.1 hypothetical protein C9J42_11615 [Photobacterium sp. GB-56]PSV31545.1 hypothetical protein C9J40_08840 [Photobacterium sp. GB-72]PSV33787.1 hypothetical protein C9J44_17200 [Photobacterium sp. GB-27]PSV46083.1 hypothetical protein C9J46_06120 [Photobacterium sp. GB-36]PSV52540.1 hypothetical protein C9J45_11630 [Photobacterium sp. GB-1]
MKFYNQIKEIINSSKRHDKKTGWLARLIYISPAQRLERLNTIFGSDQFSKARPLTLSQQKKFNDNYLK